MPGAAQLTQIFLGDVLGIHSTRYLDDRVKKTRREAH